MSNSPLIFRLNENCDYSPSAISTLPDRPCGSSLDPSKGLIRSNSPRNLKRFYSCAESRFDSEGFKEIKNTSFMRPVLAPEEPQIFGGRPFSQKAKVQGKILIICLLLFDSFDSLININF